MADMAGTGFIDEPRQGKPLPLPWRDRAGHFVPLKAAVFAALFLPGAWLALRYETGALGARPLNTLIHEIGLWTIRLLFLSLAVTPMRQVLRLPQLVAVRRMVGVAAFVYGAAHLALYAADRSFDLGRIASEIVLRVYLAIGAGALLVLLALAATSTDGTMKRLGGRRWRALHRAVYAAAALAVVHHFLQAKLNTAEAAVMAGLFAWLMLYRLAAWRFDSTRARLPASLALIGLAAALLAALAEFAWYGLATGVDPWRVLAANWNLAATPRPAAVVLAIALAALLAGAARTLIPPRR